jgi:hypothetical protein
VRSAVGRRAPCDRYDAYCEMTAAAGRGHAAPPWAVLLTASVSRQPPRTDRHGCEAPATALARGRGDLAVAARSHTLGSGTRAPSTDPGRRAPRARSTDGRALAPTRAGLRDGTG